MEDMGSSSERGGQRKVWSKIWKLPVLPKVRNFIWKLVRNGLPTNENRRYRQIADNASCELCYHRCEDAFHAVINCPHARALRSALREYWVLPAEERLRNDGPEWFLVLLDSCTEEEMADLAMILWRSWTVRNRVTQAGGAISIDESVNYLLRLQQEMKSVKASTGLAHNPSVRTRPCRPMQGCPGSRWIPPGGASMKINVDGAFNPRTAEAAIGLIARDHDGNPKIMVRCLIPNCRDAEEAEAMACLEGVKLLHHSRTTFR
jgi:hypothetical protein